MPFSEDLILTPIEQETKPVPEQVAATKAFYAAATNEESEDPISEYQTLKSELETQGYSKSLEVAQNKWVQEQDEFGKQYFTNLIADPSVDTKTKKDALSLYASSGYINPSLREKYIEQVATKSQGNRIVDEQALDELLKSFPQRRNTNIQETFVEDIKASEIGVKEWAKGLAYVGSDVLKSIPATVWGAIQGLWDRDPITAREVTAELVQNWSSNPQDPKVQAAYNTIMDKLSFFEIPYDKAFSETLRNTGSAKGAVVSGVLGEAAAGYIVGTPLIAGVRSLLKAKKLKGTPELKKGTPLDQTIVASPKAGADLATAAVKDSTGQISTAVGESAGNIIYSMALPKPFKYPVGKDIPSIHKKLAKEIKQLDDEFIKEFEYFRWDPNIFDADTRKADYDLILKTTQEIDSPTYQPANSVLSPTITSLYEGVAVFGRDANLFYHSRNEVIRAYESLNDKVKSLPEEFNSKVSIVDRLTGQKYTPEELMADPKFKSGLDRLVDIPNITENGVPVKVSKTGKTREDGTYVAATLRKNSDGSPKEITIDVDAIKTQFADKPWTKPKIEGVNPLPDKLFKTPEEWAKFVYLHEEAHVQYPNLNGTLSKADYENLVNQKALEKFNSLKDKSWETQALSAKQFAVEMEWAKEYDDLDFITFGTDPIKANLEFGIDASGLARSRLSQLIFGGTGIFPSWFEQGIPRSSIRGARQAQPFLNTIKKKISSTPFKKELSSLIEKAEAESIESYSLNQIQDLFPKLSKADAESLFETHTYWRRVIHYQHALINWQFRNKLLNTNYKNGMYIDGSYKGPINAELKSYEIDPTITVWDFDKNFSIKITLDSTKELATDVSGKRIVALRNKFTDPDDASKVYEYALLGGEKSKIEKLPDQVVPRIPGYSPIKTIASWYIDIVPKSLEVNGKLITDETPEGFKKLKEGFLRTIAAGNTKKEISKLEAEIQNKYPNHIVRARQEKNVIFDRIITDMEAHEQVLRNAKQRGERLPTLNGPAPIEDRLISLVDTIQTLTKQNNMQALESALESAFLKEYSTFLKDSTKFPALKSDIELPELATPEELTQYKNAVTIWDQYAKIKSFGTMGDRAWSSIFNKIADKLEDFNVTYKAAPLSRKVAEKGNLLFNYPRQLASTLYIALSAPRQWIVQHSPLVEMFALNPTTAVQRFVDLGAIRLALASKSEIMSKSPIDFYEAARMIAPSMDRLEFDKTVKAIEESGILEGVDLNMMTHGIFNDIDRPLIEGPWEQVYNNITAIPKAATNISKEIGFNFSEKNNQIGTWLIMKDKWIEKNPGKDWTSKKAQEEINYNTYKWTGSMTRAGAYPYQEGGWGVLLQFGAITQKLTMNLLQKNKLLSGQDKARLIAARAALWGAKTGVPFGAAIYYYIDRMAEEEGNEDLKQYANTFKRGLADRMFNELFDSLSGTEGADLATGLGTSPYGESTTGFSLVDTYIEFAKLFDGNEATNPRIPAIGATSTVLETIGRIRSWFTTKDVTNENMFKRTLLEAVHVASGMNNFAKYQLMLSTKEKLTKSGNKYGLDYTAGEAFAQIFGLTTWREVEMWDGISASMDRKDRIEKMADNVHNWLTYQMNTMKSEDPVMRYEMLVSFTTMLKDDKNWVQQDINELYEKVLDKSKRTSKNTSAFLFETYLKAHGEKNSAEMERAKSALRHIPRYKKLIDIVENKGNI